MKIIFALLVSSLLTACQTVPDMGSGLVNAAELKSEAKSGDAGCFKVSGPLGAWGVITTWINVDRGVIKTGDVTVEESCAIRFTNSNAAARIAP